MKTLTALMLALFCGVASAATVNWSIDRKSFTTSDGSSERAGGYFVQLFLYDNYSEVMSIVQSWTAPVSDASALDTYVLSTGTTGSTGAVASNFTTTEPAGTTFTLFAIAWDAASVAGAENYLVSDTVSSDAYVAPDNPTNVGKFTSASYSSSSWTAVSAVPEPSTAALALAGLALLIRRRKA